MHEFIIHLISLYDFSVVSWRTSTSHEPQSVHDCGVWGSRFHLSPQRDNLAD